jgi:type II secretory pathway component PulC
MKLSQIRILSWGSSMAIVAACGIGSLLVIQGVQNQGLIVVPNWRPQEIEVTGAAELSRLSNQRLMGALSFLTKVEPPPIPDKVPEPVSDKPVDEVIETLVLDIELALISYDDREGRHMAFLRKARDPAHPYMVGDDLGAVPPSKLTEIHRDHVIIKSDNGKVLKLYLKGVDRSSTSKVSPVVRTGSVARVVPVPPKPTPQSAPSKKVSRRYVPKSRNVEFLDAYGINVVEYNPTEEGHRRFAINEKDLKTLENQALRLMSEVAPSPSLDANGQPNGIRLDFLTDEPLAKQYGLRSGDVLTEVNNKPVTNEMEAQAIYDGLGGDTRVVPFRVLRGEKEIIIYLEMDDFPAVAPKK